MEIKTFKDKQDPEKLLVEFSDKEKLAHEANAERKRPYES